MRCSVSRMLGQVPSPTPIGGTSGDSISVICRPPAAMFGCDQAGSHPAGGRRLRSRYVSACWALLRNGLRKF
jgi:hypothetical protein